MNKFFAQIKCNLICRIHNNSAEYDRKVSLLELNVNWKKLMMYINIYYAEL